LALSAAATLWAAWGGVALDLGAPPSLHLHTQAGLLIALALTSGLTFSADPLFAALLLLRGAGPLCPELLSVAGPGLIFIAPLLALLAALRPARRSEAEARRAARLSAAAVILLGGLTLTSLGLLGAAITAVILIIDLDAPRPSPLGLLPGAGLGLAYALYAAATSVTLPPLAAALTAALVLITLARGWAWRPPSLALVIALTLMAPLSTQLTTRAATRWSRQHPPSQDRWGWRALWRQSEPRPGAPDAGP
ncbi:hypothetical protein KJ940_15615, partial [Myxococcota bacterium]|nr:hypothetical protein [Myxococcota bacterium]